MLLRRVGVATMCMAAALAVSGVAVHAEPATPSAAATASPVITRVRVIGHSAQGRTLRVVSRGTADAQIDVLVIGVIHGNEAAGRVVVQRLAHQTPPPGVRWWLLACANPDGQHRGTRQNARGVDLNRNFPTGWSGGGRPFDTYYPGRAAASEPETRAIEQLVRLVRPDVTIWYHQHMAIVVRPPLPWRLALARTYGLAAALPVRTYPGGVLHGTASTWQHAAQPLSAALVIELPAGPLSAAALTRHVRAARAVSVQAGRDTAVAP
jgi:protein MpaA